MVSSTSRPTDASPAAQPLRGGRPIRTFPFGAPAVARRLNATLQAAAADHYRPRPLPARPAPYDRKPLLEELEPRLLLSADLNPLAHDTLLAAPALHGAEFRSLADPGLPAVVTALEVAPIARASEIAFVDPAAPDYQSLIEDMRATALAQGRNLEIVLLDAERDGIRRITDVLAQRQGLDAVHIVSHATDGAVRLGSATLDAAALADRAGAIERWGAALADDGDLLFYGCDLAATAQGKALIDAIARLTGADVAASEDPTGHADRGGNWKLEFTTGRIEAQVAVSAAKQASWDHVLASEQFDWDSVAWPAGSLSNTYTVGSGDVVITMSGDTARFVSGYPVDNNTFNTGGLSPAQQSLHLYVDFATNTQQITLTIDFTHPGGVSNLSFTVFDIDNGSGTPRGFIDQVSALATIGGVGGHDPTSISLVAGGTTILADTDGDGTNNAARGNGTTTNASPTSNLGNATFTFAQSGITRITLTYSNAAGAAADPSGQAVSLHDISFTANRAPSLANGSTLAYTENQAATPINSAITVSDVDSAALASATVSITGNFASGQDVLGFINGPGMGNISGSYNPATGVLNLTSAGATATLAQWQTALRAVTYLNSSDAPSTLARTVRFVVNDGLIDSNAITSTINVTAVNDAPVLATGSTLNYTENQAASAINTLITTADLDHTTFASGTVSITGNFASGQDVLGFVNVPATMGNIAGVYNAATGVMSLTSAGASATLAQWQAALRAVTYFNSSDNPSTLARTVSYTVNDGAASSNTVTSTVNLTAVNDAPVFTGTAGGVTFIENGAAVSLVAGAAVSDLDAANFNGGSVTVSLAVYQAGDVLSINHQGSGAGQISVSGTNVQYAGTTFGTFAGGTAANLVISLNANATPAAVQALMGQLRYASTAEDPTVNGTATTRALTVTLNDGGNTGSGGAQTASLAGTITITPLTDAPVIGGAGSTRTYTENATGVALEPTLTVTDADDTHIASGSVTISAGFTAGDTLTWADQPGIIANYAGGVLTLSGNATLATYQTLLRSVAFSSTSDDPTAASASRTISWSLTDADSDGAGPGTGSATTTVNIIALNDPPTLSATALNPTFTEAAGLGTQAPPVTVFSNALASTVESGQSIVGLTLTVSGLLDGASERILVDGTTLILNGAAAGTTAGNGMAYTVSVAGGVATVTLAKPAGISTAALAALVEGIAYQNTSTDDPTAGGRVVTIAQLRDSGGGADTSAPAIDSTVSVVPVNDPPIAQDDGLTAPATILLGAGGAAWSATPVAGVTVTASSGLPGVGATLHISGNDLGVNSAAPNNRISQIEHRPNGTTESITIELGTVVTSATFTFSRLFVNEGGAGNHEQGRWVALLDGVEVASGTFVAPADNSGNDTVAITNRVFNQVRFEANTYSQGNTTATDSSDYFLTAFSATTTGYQFITFENDPLTIAAASLLANDADPEGDTLTISSVAPIVGTTLGSVSLVAGQVLYDPGTAFDHLQVGETATDTFEYTVSDGQGGFDTAIVTVLILGTNDTPVANPDSYTVAEDATLTVAAAGVLANDTDVDGDALSAVLVTGPANGSLTLNADGSFTYTPNANFNGTDAFTYRAHDGTVDSALATVTLTVTAVNDTPVANPDSYTVAEDATLTVAAAGVLANDTDVDGDALSAVLVTGPANGSLTLNADGSFTYTPNANFNGTDAFTYRAHDGTVDSALATVTLTVTAVNDTPVANPDSYTVAEDATLTVAAAGVLANDTDVDGDALSAVLVTGPANGSLTLNADGSFTYTPNANFNGTDAFTYRAHDGTVDSALATVTLTVTAVNDTPVANPDSYTVAEDATLTVAAAGVLANDTDVDGDALSAVLVTGPANGSLTLNADGSFTYTPNANFNGTDAFTYRAHDGTVDSALATVTLTVTAVNDTPVANPDSYTVAEDATLTVAAAGVLANDTDVDGDALSAVLVTGPANGSLTLNADGSFTYTPNANFNGTDAFTYRAHDGTVDSALATVTLTVTAVNDTPVANPDSYTVAEDATLTVAAAGVLANDTDVDGDALSAVLVTGPANGSLTLNADGSFTYTPNANFNGTDAFTYRAHDGTVDSALATVTLTVTAVNDTPVANPDSYTVAEDATLTVAAAGVLANDTDVDGDALSAVLVTGPANGSLTLNADGSFTYTPNANFNGTDAFTYRAHDGTVDSALATVTLTVTAVNDPPILTTNAWTIADGGTLTVTLANIGATDPDSPIGPLAFAVGSVTHGFFALAGNPAVAITTFTQQQVIDGLVRFVHDGSGNAPGFTLYVSDGSLGDGPYLGNITFVKAPGGIIGTPFDGSSGGRTGAGGTSSGPAEPPAVPAAFPLLSQVLATARNGLLNPAIQLFVRVPAAGDLDGGSAFAEAPLPGVTLARAQAGAVTLPVLPPGGELAPLQANGDSIATKLQAVMDGIAPIQAEMLAIPTKFGLDLYDPEQRRVEIALDAIRVTGLALSVGAVWWAARAASLVASLLASTPAWRHVDPLPILGRDEEEEARYGWADPREQDRARQDEERNAARLLEDGPRG